MSDVNRPAGTPQSRISNVADTVREKAEGIGAAVAETAKNLKENAGDLAAGISKTAEQAWETTRHATEEYGADISHRAEILHADATIFIRRNPVASVLSAVGVGVLLGAVLCASRGGRG